MFGVHQGRTASRSSTVTAVSSQWAPSPESPHSAGEQLPGWPGGLAQWPGGLAQTPSGRDSSDGDGVSAGGEVGQDDGNVAAGKARHVAGPARSPDPPPVHGCFDVVTLPRKTLAHAMPDDRHIADQAIILPRPSRRSAAPCRCARLDLLPRVWVPIDSGTRRVGLMASLRGRAAPGLVRHRIGSTVRTGRGARRSVADPVAGSRVAARCLLRWPVARTAGTSIRPARRRPL